VPRNDDASAAPSRDDAIVRGTLARELDGAFVVAHRPSGSSQRRAAAPPGRSRLSSADALAAPPDAQAMASASQSAQIIVETKRIAAPPGYQGRREK
jgi:hypothetical protein